MESKTKSRSIADFLIKEHPDRMGSDCFHFSASDPASNTSGFGTAFERPLAMKIAINECLERLAYYELKEQLGARSSSGFAVHDTFDQAKESAVCELIERDALLCTWLCYRPVFWFPNDLLPSAILNERAKFNANNFKLSLGVLSEVNGRFCTIGILEPTSRNDRSFGACVSSNCARTLEDSFFGVLIELRRAATAVLNLQRRGTLTQSFPPSGQPFQATGKFHFQYYLDPSNAVNIKWLLESSSNKPITEQLPQIERHEIFPSVVPEWGFAACYAKSAQVQDFYLGGIRSKYLNRRRLADWWNSKRGLNRKLHILP